MVNFHNTPQYYVAVVVIAMSYFLNVVALNYQTPDEPMMVYKGRFKDNGGCGYVLKPKILTDRKYIIYEKKKNELCFGVAQ